MGGDELLEKSTDTDLLREMIGFAAERLMALEVEELCGARARRAQRGAPQPPQRLPGPAVGDPGRRRRLEDSRAQEGQLLPLLPGAPTHRGEGADRRHPGSLCAGHLDPLGGRAGQGHGHDRHLQEPGVPALPGDRRAGAGLPRAPDRRRLVPSLARCHLRQGVPDGADRLGGGDIRRGCEHRRPPRGIRRMGAKPGAWPWVRRRPRPSGATS